MAACGEPEERQKAASQAVAACGEPEERQKAASQAVAACEAPGERQKAASRGMAVREAPGELRKAVSLELTACGGRQEVVQMAAGVRRQAGPLMNRGAGRIRKLRSRLVIMEAP